MDINTAKAFFMWCSILDGVLLISAIVVYKCAPDWAYRIHSRWFPISRETFNAAGYCFVGAMKLAFIFLNLVPWLALAITS